MISFLNGFANLFTKIETELLNADFPMASIKSLWLQMDISSWLIAHCNVLLKLLRGFVQTIHGLYGYYSVNSLHPPC